MIVFVSSFLDYIRRFVLELLQRREVVSRLFEPTCNFVIV